MSRPIQQLADSIRTKPDWQKKIVQPALLEKWCGEALRQGTTTTTTLTHVIHRDNRASINKHQSQLSKTTK